MCILNVYLDIMLLQRLLLQRLGVIDICLVLIYSLYRKNTNKMAWGKETRDASNYLSHIQDSIDMDITFVSPEYRISTNLERE